MPTDQRASAAGTVLALRLGQTSPAARGHSAKPALRSRYGASGCDAPARLVPTGHLDQPVPAAPVRSPRPLRCRAGGRGTVRPRLAPACTPSGGHAALPLARELLPLRRRPHPLRASALVRAARPDDHPPQGGTHVRLQDRLDGAPGGSSRDDEPAPRPSGGSNARPLVRRPRRPRRGDGRPGTRAASAKVRRGS